MVIKKTSPALFRSPVSGLLLITTNGAILRRHLSDELRLYIGAGGELRAGPEQAYAGAGPWRPSVISSGTIPVFAKGIGLSSSSPAVCPGIRLC
jgi:hypothetical protein